MERSIDILRTSDVINQLSYRKERHIFCKDIADVAIPVMKSFANKKITKRIITALNKALKNDTRTTDVSATLDDYGRKNIRFCSDRKSELLEYNGYKDVLIPLIKWDAPFYLSLGSWVSLGDTSQFPIGDIVGDDLRNSNERFCDLSIFEDEISNYDFAIKDAPRIVENNNNLCAELEKHNSQLESLHKHNQWIFRKG